MEPFIVFLDLDETLVKTGYLSSSGRDLFLGKIRTPEAVARFTQAKEAFLAGRPEQLTEMAAQTGVSIILSHEGADFSKDPYISKLRPGAKELIDNVKLLCSELNILTTGSTSFQTLVLDLHQIRNRFDNIYGRDEIRTAEYGRPLTKSTNVLLVDDNCNHGSGGWKSKMSAIGVLNDAVHRQFNQLPWEDQAAFLKTFADKHFICVKPWQGDPLDTELAKVWSQIKNR